MFSGTYLAALHGRAESLAQTLRGIRPGRRNLGRRSRPEDSVSYTEIYADLVGQPGALLPIFHRIQERLGHVPQEALPEIALALNLSRAEVHGVMTFYHDFRADPAGRHVIKICRAEACQAMGVESLIGHAEQCLGTPLGGTSADGEVTLEAIYCLGNCALAPALLLDGELKGRVTPERFDRLLAAARAKEQLA
jgi:formate dehydrogenase subunit gamma